jgi:K+-transporting ATPase c subunit
MLVPDQTTTLPADSVTLSGSGSDPDGTISSIQWMKVSGTGGTIISANAGVTKVIGLTEGTYIFRLTIKDNSGSFGF